MNRFRPHSLAWLVAGCLIQAPALAAEEPMTLDAVQVLGDNEQARQLSGSAAVVEPRQMDIEGTTDINQVLKTVPGVYIREEEGEGLRPNIGIRSASPGRSEKITLMEDGVLVAPAPYSNPAAYYFPTTMRMQSVEVLKGAPLLRYGPQTTGGVINMVSTPIPTERGGRIETQMDENGSTDLHAHYGDRNGDWSWLVETVRRHGGGFKEIDRSNRDTGFDIEDYVGKLRWDGERQSWQLKVQRSDETSNASYLGLSDADFDRDPNRRYGLSEIDQMVNQHSGVQLTQEFDWSERVSTTTTLYRNDYERNWFKLDGGGSLVDQANNGDANAQGILDGDIDTTGLEYKNNNRAYVSQGLQTNVRIDGDQHTFNVGARVHEDEMDRFQPVDTYDQVNGSLVYQSTAQPTGGNNRFETGEALSFWVTDEWRVSDPLTVHLALRYEDVETARTEYADADRNTVGSERSNQSDELLPGASFTYDLSDRWQALAGYHKGFSPLGGGASENEDPETSDNTELGIRYFGDQFLVEAIGFYSDFSNKVENCSVGSPCSNGDTSGSFTTGEAEVSGLELVYASQFERGEFLIPVDLSYTWTEAEISKDNATSGLQKGDRLQDIPENLFSLRVGLEHSGGWDNYAVVKYLDESCSSAGCNNTASDLDETENLTVVDWISRYALSSDTNVSLRVANLLDEQSIVSRSPDGARPNKPQTISVGLSHQF